MNLRETFKNDFSKSAFRVVDGELRIVGRYCQISAIENIYDIWLVAPDLNPISPRKMSSLLSGTQKSGVLRLLEGEAYWQTTSADDVRKVAFFCGVRKKPVLSDETRKNLRSQGFKRNVTQAMRQDPHQQIIGQPILQVGKGWFHTLYNLLLRSDTGI